MKEALIVTGHPRSGTSMMMRMLHEGGMTVIADEESLKPAPGQFNKYGSFETKFFDWLLENPGELEGRAVKIVTQFIHVAERLLVEGVPMKAIFMVRPIRAIEASLRNMKTTWDPPPAESIALGRKVLEYYDVPTLFIKYDEAVEYPLLAAEEVNNFVGGDLDVEKMAAAVDPSARHFKG